MLVRTNFYMQTGNALSIMMRRPLRSSNGQDDAWPTDGSRFATFGMGPVSEGSNATIPVVLYHSLQLPGETTVRSVAARIGEGIKINLAKDGNTSCSPILDSSTEDGEDATRTEENVSEDRVVRDATTLRFTIGRKL